MTARCIGKQLGLATFVGAVFLLTLATAGADDHFAVLKVGSETYSNVTVTSFTATDIYFNHARGMGNAKLKDLDPVLQKHFQFNRTKAGEAEQQQRQDSWRYLGEVSTRKANVPTTSKDENGDLVVSKLYARSIRGERPPQIIVDQWLTPPPDVDGKFVLVEFWSSSSEPCRLSIPHLNDLRAKFKDRLVVIGLSSEAPETVAKMTSPHMDYSVGVDPQARTASAIELTAIPHAILIDPKGIARFEGTPAFLDEKALQHLLDSYGN
jgi:cytochrome c biogenesis protein CcmG, thiol:disulfide interchange protein DsbE